MIKESKGKITEEFYALGNPALPSYLLLGDSPVLFDSGMTVMGPLYLQDLKKYLGDPHRLTYLFLTHSHFDHAGSAPFLKRNLPRLKVAAGKAAADIFKRPNAIQLIQSLSKPMEEKMKSQGDDLDVTFHGLELDRILEDGEEIRAGRRNPNPGHRHSRAHPGHRLLLPPEAESPGRRGGGWKL